MDVFLLNGNQSKYRPNMYNFKIQFYKMKAKSIITK